MNNNSMRVLQHNNLRVMYHGAFTQEMAERFVREHLLNPEEFWTKMPLPSIAVNDPKFLNNSENDWSGQAEGLTYQRAIRALENYGMLSELTQIGNKLIECVGRYNTFPQQFDPFTGEFSEADKRVDYGPTVLSVLEYISRFHGVHMQFDKLYWGALGRKQHSVKYIQQWGDDQYEVLSSINETVGLKNGYELFRVTNGVRIVTNWDGEVETITNILPISKVFTLNIRGVEVQLKLDPNQKFNF